MKVYFLRLASTCLAFSSQKSRLLAAAIPKWNLSGVAASATAGAMHLGAGRAAIHGYHIAFLVSAVFMGIASAVAALMIRSPRAAHEKQNAPQKTQLQSTVH